MKIKAFSAVLALFAALSAPALADRLDDVRARGKLLVGVSDTTPPFAFRGADGAIKGYDIDLVKAVAAKLNLGLEMTPLSSAERIPLLKEGKLDFVATSMTRTGERLKEIDFSHIYFVTPHGVIVKRSSGIKSVHELAGRKASSANTSTAGPNLKEAEPKVQLVYVRDYSLAFAALKAGEVDAFTTDKTVLESIMRQDGKPEDYVMLSDFTKSRNVGFAMKQDEPRFKDAVNRALLDIEVSGEAKKIWDAWFGPGSEQPMARSFTIRADY